MKSPLRIAAVAACAVTVGSCTNNDISMVITFFAKATTMNMCVVSNQSMVSLSGGVLDTSAVVQLGTAGYFAAPVVQNNLVERATMGQVERDGIFVSGIEVQLQSIPGESIAGKVSKTSYAVEAVGGWIKPGGTVSVVGEIIPSEIAAELNAFPDVTEVIAHMRVDGTRADGPISTGWVDFPVALCRGCLAQGTNTPCPPGGFAMGSVSLGGCSIQQDDITTCCCQGFQANGTTCLPGESACGKFAPMGGTGGPDGGV
jgi:hypothetical protein